MSLNSDIAFNILITLLIICCIYQSNRIMISHLFHIFVDKNPFKLKEFNFFIKKILKTIIYLFLLFFEFHDLRLQRIILIQLTFLLFSLFCDLSLLNLYNILFKISHFIFLFIKFLLKYS